MRRIALIKNGVVENAIVWDSSENFIPDDESYIAVEHERASTGWMYDGVNFIEPQIVEEQI